MHTFQKSVRRPIWLLLALFLWGSFASAVTPSVAFAEDNPKAEAADEKDTGHKMTGPEWFIRSSGLIGLFILILSIYFISVVIQLFIQFRTEVVMPPEIVAACESMLEAKDFRGIYEQVKVDDSFFSRVLNTGIGELPGGLAEARDAMERFGESIIVGMEKKISIMAVLGTLGPMIGLLGTWKGMISSFSAIAMGGASLDAAAVADGISEALLLTFEGVFLSVPAIYFYSFFKNRVSTISTAVMLRADEFLRHFAHAARKGTGRPAAAAGAPPRQ